MCYTDERRLAHYDLTAAGGRALHFNPTSILSEGNTSPPTPSPPYSPARGNTRYIRTITHPEPPDHSVIGICVQSRNRQLLQWSYKLSTTTSISAPRCRCASQGFLGLIVLIQVQSPWMKPLNVDTKWWNIKPSQPCSCQTFRQLSL